LEKELFNIRLKRDF